MLSLGRYGAAREMYQEALTLDGGKNAVAKKGVAMCWEEERRVKIREMALVKQRQQQQEEEERKMKEEQKREEEKKKEEEKDSTEDDLLDDFFNEVEETNTTTTTATPEPTTTTPEPAAPQSNNISKQLTKLGTPLSQINRLLSPNYEWKNLNPFYVLDIPHTAPLDIISRRYKALSLLIHPDKCSEQRAKEAFEQVRIAMILLKEEEKRKHVHD
uniref:J domain-containing protein n=2 Tax=Ditylum brightwellii TaxID=49249 RepID=A0A7S1ZNL9_9STRA|mmetsp:Transcript_35825/g.53401  ORF Transcript_35825/g.53401 Transcript_35825/m.53401 type:complete len:215 (+) Transcript_35825:951-1595(+)